jgi:O-antigen ligase
LAADPPGQRLAVAAEALYLANLMLAPGLAFLAIAWLWRQRDEATPLARCHLEQTFFVSLWGGVLLVLASAAILLLGGLDWSWTWIAVILYFTCVHSTLIVFGVVGLAKALAGKAYVYPLIGRRCE